MWVLNSRYCPQMSDGNAVVHFTEKKVEGALQYATKAICNIKKYNKATFKEAYDIERNEKFNIHSKDNSRLNAIWKFNKAVKTGDVMLYVSGSQVLGYYIVTGTESEITPGEGYCFNSWKAETVEFKGFILINGIFGNPFFKEVGENRIKVIELLNIHYATVTDKPTMEQAWRDMLNDQSLYHLIDPSDLMKPISETYPELYSYLKERYW